MNRGIFYGLLSLIFALTAVRSVKAEPSAAAQNARGIVYDDKNGNGVFDADDRPLPRIRVSNGREVTATDEAGRYLLPVTNDSILFVIKPRGWRTPISEEKLPKFYYIHKPAGSPKLKYPGVAPTGDLPNSIDFALYPQEEPNRYQVLIFGDPQPRNQVEVDWIAHDVVEEAIGTRAAFGISLGDIAHNNLETLEPLNQAISLIGIPWYNVIGNHDINFDASSRELANETFERVYGPSYYSFDYGPVHYVVLDDIKPIYDAAGKHKGLRGEFGERQLKFIENDLRDVPDEQLVILMMHIPFLYSTAMDDRHELYRLIEKRTHCISLSAHSHLHEHQLIDQKDKWMGTKPHHQINMAAICGSWWSGALDERGIPHSTQWDGTPNGYAFLNIDGADFTLDFKVAGRDVGFQMEVDAPESVKSGESALFDVYVNFSTEAATRQFKCECWAGNGCR